MKRDYQSMAKRFPKAAEVLPVLDRDIKLLGLIVEKWLEYRRLQTGRGGNGSRGRPIKPWPDYLREQLAIEQVATRKENIRRAHPGITAGKAFDQAIEETASDICIAQTTLLEWESHRRRMHNRPRKKRR